MAADFDKGIESLGRSSEPTNRSVDVRRTERIHDLRHPSQSAEQPPYNGLVGLLATAE
jgi:hypothetical protein